MALKNNLKQPLQLSESGSSVARQFPDSKIRVETPGETGRAAVRSGSFNTGFTSSTARAPSSRFMLPGEAT